MLAPCGMCGSLDFLTWLSSGGQKKVCVNFDVVVCCHVYCLADFSLKFECSSYNYC